MYKETEFQRTIKWFLYGTAGACALLQTVLLFYEFSFFKGIGMFFNAILHLSSIFVPVLIILLFYKMKEDKEVYANYALAMNIFICLIVDLILMFKYIKNIYSTKGFSIGLIIGFILLVLCEALYGLILIGYGLDKVTSVLPIIWVIVVCIFRGGVLNAVDSAFKTYAYNTVKGSIYSVWSFMQLLLYVLMIVCMILYLDLDFLLNIINNPRELFTKNTLFGTYTNLYLNDDRKTDSLIEQGKLGNKNTNDDQVVEAFGKCPDCGKIIYSNQEICSFCGCPAELVCNNEIRQDHENSIGIGDDNEQLNEMNGYYLCPDCGKNMVYLQEICPQCGCPNSEFIFNPGINNTNE
jgi:hypothetical protein